MHPLLLSLALAGLAGGLQLGLVALARSFDLRLPKRVIASGTLLPFLLLAPWLAPGRLLVPTGALAGQVPGTAAPATPDPHRLLNDAVLQFLPWELEVRHALRQGKLPFWTDALDGGSSPWVNPQAAVLSPIAMFCRLLPIQEYLLAALFLKIVVAFEGAWLLSRALGARSWAAALAGLGFGLGGGVLGWALFPHTQAVVWVPWVVLGALRTVRRPKPARVLGSAVATAALLLSGHPETALGGGLLAAAVALYGRRRGRSPWPGLAAAAGAAGLAFALAAPQLVPFAAILGETQRAVDTAAAERPGHLVAGSPASWFFEGRGGFLLAPLAPRAFGEPYHEPFRGPLSWPDATTPYVGTLLVAGAFSLLGRRGRGRRLGLCLLAAAAVAVLLASEPLPLMGWLFKLAPLRKLAYSRLLLPASCALAVAGGLGLSRLARRGSAVSWAGFAAVWVAALLVRFDPWVLATGLAASLALVLARRPRLGWLPRLALPLLLLFDLVPWGQGLLPRGEPALFYPPSPLLAAVHAELAAAPAAEVTGTPWRVVGEDYLVYPGVLAVYGLEDVRAHNPLTPISQLRVLGAAFDFAPSMHRYFAPFHRPGQPFLDFLNVRVVVSNAFLPAPEGLERIDTGDFAPYQLWRNAAALPRWFLAAAGEAMPAGAVPAWVAHLEDPRRVALDAAEVGRWRPAAPPTGATVELAESRPGRTRLRLAGLAAGEGLLATSIPAAPGWQARAAGRPLRTLRVNGAYLGVVLPAGSEEVELRFRPRGFSLGFALAVLGFLAVGGLLAAHRQQSEPPAPPPGRGPAPA